MKLKISLRAFKGKSTQETDEQDDRQQQESENPTTNLLKTSIITLTITLTLVGSLTGVNVYSEIQDLDSSIDSLASNNVDYDTYYTTIQEIIRYEKQIDFLPFKNNNYERLEKSINAYYNSLYQRYNYESDVEVLRDMEEAQTFTSRIDPNILGKENRDKVKELQATTYVRYRETINSNIDILLTSLNKEYKNKYLSKEDMQNLTNNVMGVISLFNETTPKETKDLANALMLKVVKQEEQLKKE